MQVSASLSGLRLAICSRLARTILLRRLTFGSLAITGSADRLSAKQHVVSHGILIPLTDGWTTIWFRLLG
jgi:hypothetical protein